MCTIKGLWEQQVKVDADLVLFVRHRRWQLDQSQKAIARELAGTVGRTTIQRIDRGDYDHLVVRALVERLPNLSPPADVPRCPTCGFRARRVEGRCPVCAAAAMRAAGWGPWKSPPVAADVDEPDDPNLELEFQDDAEGRAARQRYEELHRRREPGMG